MQPELLADLQRALRLNGEDGLGAAFCSGWTHNLKQSYFVELIEELSKIKAQRPPTPSSQGLSPKAPDRNPRRSLKVLRPLRCLTPTPPMSWQSTQSIGLGTKPLHMSRNSNPSNLIPQGSVYVRRQWNDVQNIAGVLEAHLDGFHHDAISGGVNAISPGPSSTPTCFARMPRQGPAVA